MSRYTVAPSALADLDEIWFYIARKASVEVAERFADSITGTFPLLAANPNIGRHRPNLGKTCAAFPSTTTASTIGKTVGAVFVFFT
ncbi:MAG: type II toxin-antitoxin system RelE/ParE family toxin [Acidobacteriia bacterium]|nr:type II toxin-antitoxin system RelE/ParE family toxin [Terriglobia bacterium]